MPADDAGTDLAYLLTAKDAGPIVSPPKPDSEGCIV
jgi:hypothetical protein